MSKELREHATQCFDAGTLPTMLMVALKSILPKALTADELEEYIHDASTLS